MKHPHFTGNLPNLTNHFTAKYIDYVLAGGLTARKSEQKNCIGHESFVKRYNTEIYNKQARMYNNQPSRLSSLKPVAYIKNKPVYKDILFPHVYIPAKDGENDLFTVENSTPCNTFTSAQVAAAKREFLLSETKTPKKPRKIVSIPKLSPEIEQFCAGFFPSGCRIVNHASDHPDEIPLKLAKAYFDDFKRSNLTLQQYIQEMTPC